jgi:hypothetical protein
VARSEFTDDCGAPGKPCCDAETVIGGSRKTFLGTRLALSARALGRFVDISAGHAAVTTASATLTSCDSTDASALVDGD